MSASTPSSAANRAPIDILISPFARFARLEAAGGILLLLATLLALVWANSPWEHNYHDIWHTTFTIGVGRYVLSWSRHIWVNDGLMAIFFFLVGLEIKREVLIGELSSLRRRLGYPHGHRHRLRARRSRAARQPRPPTPQSLCRRPRDCG
jgi:NhaA family Na+:H+ antiporter